MKLTVIGSTGRTGRHVVSDATRRGHEVTAFTRRPDALAGVERLAAVVHGDGRDPAVVARAVDGADAVIAIVAAPSRRGPHEAAAVARCVTAAMAGAGVSRLVVTSAYPVVGTRPRLPMTLLRVMLARPYADVRKMEAVVSASGLAWTVVRLNRLTDGAARDDVEVSRDLLDRPAGLTRADAGAFLLDAAESDAWARTAVNLAGRSPAGRRRPHLKEQHS